MYFILNCSMESAKRYIRIKRSPTYRHTISIRFLSILINPKSESTAEKTKTTIKTSMREMKMCCTLYIYILKIIMGEHSTGKKNKTQDMKISFRCFFDRTRCVREIRMVKKSFFFIFFRFHYTSNCGQCVEEQKKFN